MKTNMKINKSAQFLFDDDKNQVVFTWGLGKSKCSEKMSFNKSFYPIAKGVFEEFLSEPDFERKDCKVWVSS